jgi:hypothetical protein
MQLNSSSRNGKQNMSVRNKNELTKLPGQLSNIKTEGLAVTKLTNGSRSETKPASRSSLTSLSQSAAGLKRSSLNAKSTRAIRFGSPSHNATSSTKGSSELSNLIRQSSSRGVSNLLGGDLLGTLGGLGGLFSHVGGWFGRDQATEEPLTLFRLSDSRTQEVSITSDSGGSSNGSAQRFGLYNLANSSTKPTNEIDKGSDLQNQRAQIVETVRLALLTSSSLNDVIGEI